MFGIHRKSMFNQTNFDTNEAVIDNLIVGNLTILNGSLSVDTLTVDSIVGKTISTQLSLLSNTITSTNTGYLSSMNQSVATTGAPSFTSLYIRDSALDHTINLKTVSNEVANRILTIPLMGADDSMVLLALGQTVTNKSIDADTNTITNIENADIKALAGIDASKISTGLISNTEFNFLNGQNQFVNNSSLPTFASLYLWDGGVTKMWIQVAGLLAVERIAWLPVLTQEDTFAFLLQSQSFTNKTIDADLNTITNIENADIKTGANIDPNKIQYLKKSVNNYGFGDLALNSVTTMLGSCAFGFQSLKSAVNTNCNYCCAFGYESLELNTSGTLNSGFGVDTLIFNTSGDRNTAVGAFAGFVPTTGSNNTLIGAYADVSTNSFSDCIAIGYLSIADATARITVGTASNTSLKLPGTNFNTDGILISASHLISSVTTITPVITFDSGLKTDTISEETATAGVTIDGALVKDGNFVCPDNSHVKAQEIRVRETGGALANFTIIRLPALANQGGDYACDIPILNMDDTFCLILKSQTLSTKTIDNSCTISGSIVNVDTISEFTGGVGTTIDSLLIKDGAIRIVESASNPITTTASTGSLWLSNTNPQALYMTSGDDTVDNLVFGIRSSMFSHSEYGLTFGITTAFDPTGLVLTGTAIGVGKGATFLAGEIYTVTSVSSGTGGLARFTFALTTAPTVGHAVSLSVATYTAGVYCISSSATTWVELTGVVFGANSTGVIYRPDILIIGHPGLITIDAHIDVSSPNIGRVIQGYIYRTRGGAVALTNGVTYHQFPVANYITSFSTSTTYQAVAGDHLFVAVEVDLALTLTFYKYVLSIN